MISKTKPFKINYFLLFSFAITKVFVAIRSVEDGTRMVGIWFQLSPSMHLLIFKDVCVELKKLCKVYVQQASLNQVFNFER